MFSIRLLTAVIALVYLAIGFSSPLMTLYLQELGADFFHISLILTSYSATTLLSNYAWGQVSDRLGRRKPILLIGLAGLAGSYLLLSRVPSANWAWAVRIGEGVVVAAYMTPSLALMGDLLSGGNRRGRKIGLYRGVASFMFAVGAFLGGRVADASSIATVLAICAAVYLAAALAALFVQERPAPAQPLDPNPQAALPPARAEERLPLAFLAGAVLWTAAHAAGASMWPNYMAALGYTKTVISSLWGLTALVEFPSMALAGVASDAVGRAPLLFAGGAAASLVHIGYLSVAIFLPALLAVQVLRGFAFGSFTATGMTFAAEWGSQQRRGRNSGVYNAANGGGSILGTFLGGTLVQLFGFGALYAVCAIFAAGSAVAFVILRRSQLRERLQQTEPAIPKK